LRAADFIPAVARRSLHFDKKGAKLRRSDDDLEAELASWADPRGGLEKPDEVFEAIARLDHPDAEAVLTMIGRHATDKKTAKAARRAAYKASTRRAARR
jgi:hypothetical protein